MNRHGEVQRLDADGQGFEQGDGAAQHREAQDFPAARIGQELLVLDHDAAVGRTHGHGEASGAAHEHTLDHGLAAHAFRLIIGKESQGPVETMESPGENVHQGLGASFGVARVFRFPPTMEV